MNINTIIVKINTIIWVEGSVNIKVVVHTNVCFRVRTTAFFREKLEQPLKVEAISQTLL